MTEETLAPDSPAALTSTTVLALFAADHVAVAPDGKMYVNGGFISLMRFPAFPAVQPTLGMAAVILLPFQDTMRNHVIRLGLRGPDREELPIRVEAGFRAAPTLETEFGEAGIVPFGVTVTNVEIPRPGVYELVLWFDNVERQTYRLRAIQSAMAMVVGAAPPPAAPDPAGA